MIRFLFQGDSITDAGRNRDDFYGLGNGYPMIIGSEMLCKYPGEYEFINKAVSGDRIVDIYARIKRDIINLKPDVMSLLVGVNDVWHDFSHENGISAQKYEKLYNMLLDEIIEALPKTKIIILEPYLLKGAATKENWAVFRSEVEKRAAAARRIAEQRGLDFVPLMEIFDKAAQTAPADYWLRDGVHPAYAGHALIAGALSEKIR